MLDFFRSAAAVLTKKRALSGFGHSSAQEDREDRILVLVKRKHRLIEIIRCVQGTSSRFTARINHADSLEELDLVQADLFTFLARDRGETYAHGVLFEQKEPQQSGYSPLVEAKD